MFGYLLLLIVFMIQREDYKESVFFWRDEDFVLKHAQTALLHTKRKTKLKKHDNWPKKRDRNVWKFMK